MSYPRYPKYKQSGVAWLGEVPAHWDVCALKRVVSLRSGETITADRIDDTGPYPVIGGNGLRGFTSAFTHDGTFAAIGRQGALCGNVNYGVGKFWASEHAIVASPIVPVSTFWLGELLRSMNLNQYSTSAAQPGLAVEGLRELQLALPPLEEQTAIANFLRCETQKIDLLVAEQRRLLELLREKRQAVVTQAFTRGIDLRVPMKPSGIEWVGDVPAHWEVTRLANAFREVAEPGTDDLPVLSVSIHDGVSDRELDGDELDRKVTRSEDRSKYKRVVPGDLVYNMMRAWQGAFGAVAVEGMVSPAYVVARPRANVVTAYVEHLLKTPAAVEQMRRHSQGVTDFRLRLYWDAFKNIRVALPPCDEAVAICDAITRMDESFNAVSEITAESIALLQARRTTLVSAAVTGKIDVRELVNVSQAEAA